MRKNIVRFAFMILFSLASYCRAEEIKFLTENSPYYLQHDFLIKKGDTFTVEPGVIIEMAKDTSIIVEGRIEIAGYPKGGEVIFKAVGPFQNYNKGFWRGIVIKSKEKNVIHYAVIQHSKVGIEVSEGASCNITNDIITQNKTGMKSLGAKELLVARNSFLGNFIDIEMAASAGTIEKNYFDGGLTALRLKESYPLLKKNSFQQGYKSLFEHDNQKNFSVGENFYGGVGEEDIKNLIAQSGRGKFIFAAFLKTSPALGKD